MVRRKLSDAERWQAVGMVRGGLSYRQTAERFNVSHSVIVRLLQRVGETGDVKERHRTGRPVKTTPREDRLLKRLARRDPFSTANTLRNHWIVNGRISRRTVNRRLNNARLHARRPIKRPQLTVRHKTARLQWARDHMGWNVRSWQRVHWSDESRFLLKPVDGRVRVWRPRNTAFHQNHILGTTAFGGGGVTVWGCFSLNCKLDLFVLDGTLTGQKYLDQILRPLVVPHIDNHPLAHRPIFMDDNARPHRARIVQDYLQQEQIQRLPWPAMSPDMNPIEHVWDYLGRKLNARNPKCQNIQELRNALVQEWQLYPQQKLRRLIHGMRRRVQELYRVRGGYTHY